MYVICICICMYIYTYIYIYVYTDIIDMNTITMLCNKQLLQTLLYYNAM